MARRHRRIVRPDRRHWLREGLAILAGAGVAGAMLAGLFALEI